MQDRKERKAAMQTPPFIRGFLLTIHPCICLMELNCPASLTDRSYHPQFAAAKDAGEEVKSFCAVQLRPAPHSWAPPEFPL